MSDLAVLPVALPIVGAALAIAVGIRFDRVGWPIAAVVAIGQVAVTATLAWLVATGGRIRYELAGFAPPAGIELVVDGLSAIVALLVAVVAAGVLVYARRAGPRSSAFYAEYLLLLAGLSGMALTGDAFNLYVFLEITGLATYALIASGESGRAAVAALKYLIIGTVGASIYLLGVGYAFIATGTLNMIDLADQLAAVGYDATLVQAAFVLMVGGLAVKTAIYPLHVWQPDAYRFAPDSVSAYVAALVSTVSAYALARTILTVFTVEFLAANPILQTAVVWIAALSVIAGSALAVMQTEVKRMLAYSSVSQFGLVIAAFAIANETAVLGGTIHLVGHAIMKGGLFLAAGVIALSTGARTVDGYRGLARRAPVPAVAFAVLAIAMVGVPPTVGFLGKWNIVLGAVEGGAWVVAPVLVSSALLTLAYFGRLLERMFVAEPLEDTAEAAVAEDTDVAADGGVESADDRPVSLGMIGVVVLAAILAVALGFAGPIFESLLEPTLERVIV
ncbi:monovalent cation/H+ antiporter subunit D family protein [Halorhabdus sp. CBA1104]|uniref:monovalent cation/H+ antiporter subunit D family protein n=1 Tax=Halorhabdus sp. CBA1104 TaxID=1380432 RepID=UPI0012B31000|nr:monovalent cation/H+ antiporter subunit D family protein [Halorhabdus sp. CBA1104]QGN06633.1 monovalent cation/H+ antiporter subunit D family protein [Halorhabdus sp. CBA1104]